MLCGTESMLSARVRRGGEGEGARCCSLLSLFFSHAGRKELEKPAERWLAAFSRESMLVSKDLAVSFIRSSMASLVGCFTALLWHDRMCLAVRLRIRN